MQAPFAAARISKSNRAQRMALERFTRRVAAGHDFDGESFTVPPTLTGRDL